MILVKWAPIDFGALFLYLRMLQFDLWLQKAFDYRWRNKALLQNYSMFADLNYELQGGAFMDIDNLEYSERNGKYHIVFMPRFRKKLYTRR